MRVHRVDTYKDVEAALRQNDLKQALYDEGGILMDKVLVTLHGEEHRNRRAIESQLFRRNFFRYYENDVFPFLLDETLQQFLDSPSIDLKTLGYRIMVHLSLSFAGIDRGDGSVAEADAQHRLLIQLGQAATIGQYKGDRQEILEEISSAIKEFAERFFAPSRARREELINKYESGEIGEEELPRDILTVLLLNEERLKLPDELLVREVAFFYLAASHTSVHTLVHAANEIFCWYAKAPGKAMALANDLLLMQRFVHESMRLHPSSPEAWRRATTPILLNDGSQVSAGEKVVIDLQTANRDTRIFGPDAARFNPFRDRVSRVSPAGLSFGGGMHVCIGMNLVAGKILKEGETADSDNHQFGTIVLILKELLLRGMAPDPHLKAKKIENSERDLWRVFPVLFKNLDYEIVR